MNHGGKSGHREYNPEAALLVPVDDDSGLDQGTILKNGEKLRSLSGSRELVVWMWKMTIKVETITMPELRVRRNLQT